jgi:hypothetical protein
MVLFIEVKLIVYWHQHFNTLLARELENLCELMLRLLGISLCRIIHYLSYLVTMSG